jgi:hypothetical protein
MDLDRYSYVLNGRVVVFYPIDQTADIKICVEREYSNSENNRNLKPREILLKVPCHTPSGGGWSMTMPIKAGDTCILFFNQIGYDHWLFEDKDEGGTITGDKLANPVPHLRRKFSENDGYALVGLNTIPRAVLGYSELNSEWRGADPALQVIRLKPDHHIEIESSVQVTVIAPSVLVQCDNATVETDTAVVNAASTISVTAGTSASVTTPILELSCETSITATTPTLTVSGDLVVGGGASVGGDIEATGGSTVGGDLTVTGSGMITGIDVAAHVHDVIKEGQPSGPPS